MSIATPRLPDIPEAERTPLVDALLELIHWQSGRIEQLEDEIQKLKKQTRKPKFKSSDMDTQTEPTGDRPGSGNKKGPKRSKTQHLTLHEEQVIYPEDLPEGARFKGYRDKIVQDLIIRPHNIRYRLAEYETPAGYIVAP